jgi:hypothetical protein
VLHILAGKGISTMGHLPYSPDLTPTDLWLFPKLKSILKGKRFLDIGGHQICEKVLTFLFRTSKTLLNHGQGAGTLHKIGERLL